MRRALALCVLLGGHLASGAPGQVKRVAVLVGANAAANGRSALHFASTDARQMAELLEQVGGFAREDLRLLEDPSPDQVLAALDAALASTEGWKGESLLLFYYSGHSDDHALYPSGRPLALDALKARLEHGAATVRLGIIDACRGGGWTQTKGLIPGQPFPVAEALTLSSQGTVLISSSSGLENAHESEALGGSFFTHHLIAGLRGAADRTDDGEVTVAEAFAYAQELTVRDTAIATAMPQHPSYQLNIKGQRDLALTWVRDAKSTLTLVQTEGPLQVVRLPSGQLMAELPSGPRSATLALPSGRYLVMTRRGEATKVRGLALEAATQATVTEASLTPGERPVVRSKRFERAPPTTESTLPADTGELSARLGVVHSQLRSSGGSSAFDPYSGTPRPAATPITAGLAVPEARPGLVLQGVIALDDRLQLTLPIPGITYRLGDTDSRQLLLWAGGVGGLQITPTDLAYVLGAGVDARLPTAPAQSLGFGLRVKTGGYQGFNGLGVIPGLTWIAEAGAAYSLTIADTVTLNLGVATALTVVNDGHLPKGELQWAIGLGSILERGTRALPLVQVHLTERWSLDLSITIRRRLTSGDTYDSYLVGLSYTP